MSVIDIAVSYLLLIVSTISSIIPVVVAVAAVTNGDDDGELKRELVRVGSAALNAKKRITDDLTAARKKQRKKRRASLLDHDRAKKSVNDDWLSPVPRFDDRQFERMFRITRSIFQQLLQVCAHADHFFTTQEDAIGRQGIDPSVKLLIALKMLAYGTSGNAYVDYFQMGEVTAQKCFKKFCRVVSSSDSLLDVYGRKMNRTDAKKISELHERQHGVAGMLGSLDCMHVPWKNCPVACQGSQMGKSGYPTIVLEAMADYNLWFWHFSFGFPGSLNDINIWDRSCLLKTFLSTEFAEEVDFDFEVGGTWFRRLWVMVDGIYPELSRFVKTIQEPIGQQACNYAIWQEASRKDIERAFGVLQRKFHFLVKKVELWYVKDISESVVTCILLHNMMVAVRLSQGEEENSSFYVNTTADVGAVAESIVVSEEPEKEDVDRRIAEINLHQRLGVLTDDRRGLVDSANERHIEMQYVQERWNRLYDKHEHANLRKACMKQLKQNETQM